MICIEDIAHGLSQLCRFSGQTLEFYSVAQHSVMVSDVVTMLDGSSDEFPKMERDKKNELALVALLHDASEAYIIDLPTPVKAHVQGYVELEHAVMTVIAKRFDLDIELFAHPLVKHADMTMLATEKRDLLGPEPQPWIAMPKPYARHLIPWEPKQAEQNFLMQFDHLRGVR
jgi:hypothetical protein